MTARRAARVDDVPQDSQGRDAIETMAKARAEALGWHVEKTSRYDRRSKRNHDLFGFADLIALNISQTLLVQATDGSHHAARVKKIVANPLARVWLLGAGRRIQVWSWRRNAKGEGVWRTQEVRIDDFE